MMTALGISRALISLLKLVFLVWTYVRTKILAAAVYAIFLAVGSLTAILIYRLFIIAFTGSANLSNITESDTLHTVRIFWAVCEMLLDLIEMGLFIWLIQSALTRSTPRNDR